MLESKLDYASIPKLNSTNYSLWSTEVEALLMTKGSFSIVCGEGPMPSESEPDDLKDWKKRSNAVAGTILLSLEEAQRVHIIDIRCDPVLMWKKLRDVHLQKNPVQCFNAYQALLNIQKSDDKTLPELIVCVQDAINKVKQLRSEKTSVEDIDSDLSVIALVKALSEQYSAFRSALMLLPKLDMASVSTAFQAKESTRAASLAMAAQARQSTPNTMVCDFCKLSGHLVATCFKYNKASLNAQKEMQDRKANKHKKKQDKANIANSSLSEPATTQESAQQVQEFAGNASVSTPNPTDPHSPLICDANSDWNTDTGASAHMTPHRHWFTTYTQHRTPICLANNNIVYSAGVGSVRFQPVVNGKLGRLLEFERVLHVPDLRNNLLSVFYLSVNKGYFITIDGNRMNFHLKRLNNQVMFTASVNVHNTGYLDGHVVPVTHFAGAVSTCTVDVALWHCRFAHLNYGDIHKIVQKGLVQGLVLQSAAKPDPICEPCLAGKQHRGPIPKVSHLRSSSLLGLIHSDVHGPLPVCTRSGYCYWITFIDDFSRFWVVIQLRQKSDAFDAFKRFKVFAENQLDAKIKCLRDDKGGEYMSKEFDNFLAANGIVRQHTVRNEPHQNGVAERANRTIAEGITSMLNEAKLPANFWGHALNAFVHVHNWSPTSALKDSTPFTIWHNFKPDVSHLRVFGCTAYVHIQKDKCKGLQSHTQKCVFVGYPSDYKGWIFFNPDTKLEIISNTAEFDERYYPGNSKAPVTLTDPLLEHGPAIAPGTEDEEPVDQGRVQHLDINFDAPQPLPAPQPQAPAVQSPSPSPEVKQEELPPAPLPRRYPLRPSRARSSPLPPPPPTHSNPRAARPQQWRVLPHLQGYREPVEGSGLESTN